MPDLSYVVNNFIQLPDYRNDSNKSKYLSTLITKEPSIEETFLFVRALHHGQKDFGGQPYIEHLIAVHRNLLQQFPDADEDEQKAALLHDSVEDVVLFLNSTFQRRFDLDDLRFLGFSSKTIEIVKLLTKEEIPANKFKGLSSSGKHALSQELYLAGIRKLCQTQNRGALRVKFSDNMHNSDRSRQGNILPQDVPRLERLYERYKLSMILIQDTLLTVDNNIVSNELQVKTR